jgi:hydroxymethylpyrimidine pyrophosphatase-like HAD family hydrolase
MFQVSGLSIAMGNGDDRVRQAATEVTTTNEDEGFANAVEKFILKS